MNQKAQSAGHSFHVGVSTLNHENDIDEGSLIYLPFQQKVRVIVNVNYGGGGCDIETPCQVGDDAVIEGNYSGFTQLKISRITNGSEDYVTSYGLCEISGSQFIELGSGTYRFSIELKNLCEAAVGTTNAHIGGTVEIDYLKNTTGDSTLSSGRRFTNKKH